MAWYKTGTITVTNGSTTVIGSGTQWILNAEVGEALYINEQLYEITNIASDTALTIAPAYLGATAAGQAYVIVPSQSYIRDLAEQASDLVNQYSTIAAFAGQGKFGDGTLAAPGIRYSDDLDTGFFRSAANEVTFVAGGVAQFKYNASGVSFITGGALVGTTATQTLTNKTLISPVINSPTGLVKADVGLGNVDNTSDATKNSAPATLTNKTLTSPVVNTPNLTGGTINNATIGASTPSTVASTNLSYTGTLTGGTGVINIGSGQVFKDASGNVGIGTSSPIGGSAGSLTSAGVLAVKGFLGEHQTSTGVLEFIDNKTSIRSYGATAGTGFIAFNTGGGGNSADTEHARIDASGNLLVGTTFNVGAKFNTFTNINSGIATFRNSLTTGITNDQLQVTVSQSTNLSGFHFYRCYSNVPNSATVQFGVRGDGVVFAQNTTIQSLSDVRTKENVRNADDGLQTILGLRPVRFDFKEGFGNNRKNQLGFIAQEVETVFSDAVDVAGEKDENGDPYKSVGPSAMIPVIVKAIQELSAKVDTLQDELNTLKGN